MRCWREVRGRGDELALLEAAAAARCLHAALNVLTNLTNDNVAAGVEPRLTHTRGSNHSPGLKEALCGNGLG
jgi:hypothetical protein